MDVTREEMDALLARLEVLEERVAAFLERDRFEGDVPLSALDGVREGVPAYLAETVLRDVLGR